MNKHLVFYSFLSYPEFSAWNTTNSFISWPKEISATRSLLVWKQENNAICLFFLHFAENKFYIFFLLSIILTLFSTTFFAGYYTYTFIPCVINVMKAIIIFISITSLEPTNNTQLTIFIIHPCHFQFILLRRWIIPSYRFRLTIETWQCE